MKFVITGGLGFIGYNVVKLLEDLGHTCYVLDIEHNYQNSAAMFIERKKLVQSNIINIDIRNRDDLYNFFQNVRPDIVINLASYPNQRAVESNPAEATDVMILGLLNLITVSNQFPVKRFVHVSSSMVYGNFVNGVDETAVCNPVGQYGILKLAGEQLVKQYLHQYTIIRPSAVYGELDVEDRVISKFITNVLKGIPLEINGPTEVMDFTHVSDTARGIVEASLFDHAPKNTYNITCSKDPYSLVDVAKIVIRHAGKGSYVIKNKSANMPSRGLLSTENARTDFGYESTVTVEEGVRRYYDWYLQNPTLWGG